MRSRNPRKAVMERSRKRARTAKATKLQLWQAQVDRLTQSIARLEATPTLQPEVWLYRQVAYFRKLLGELMLRKPKR